VTALVLVVLEHHRSEIHARENVPEARRQTLLLLEITAERQDSTLTSTLTR
jgi:hypothetical protein